MKYVGSYGFGILQFKGGGNCGNIGNKAYKIYTH